MTAVGLLLVGAVFKNVALGSLNPGEVLAHECGCPNCFG
jgi:hypothetical protein